MGFNFNIFSSSGGTTSSNGFSKYPSAATLPASAADGDVAITLDTDDLYAYNIGLNSWVIVGGPGVAFSVSDTNSIDLTLAGNVLQGLVRISGITGLPSNTLGVSLSVYAGSSPGIIGYVPTGNFIEVTSSILQFTGPGKAAGGTFGIQVNQATGSTPGFLSAADWTSFNGKAPSTRNIGTTFPILGGGDLSADRVLSMPAANGTTGGYLTTTDWTTFNTKVSATRSIATTFPLLGGGDFSADRTHSIPAANGTTGGYLTSADWTTFNSKQAAIGYTPTPSTRSIATTFPIQGGGDLTADRTLSMPAANGTTSGYLSNTDWTTFNNKQAAISIGTFSYAAFAQGITLFSGTLTLGVGDATNPGAIGTTAQTIAGVKTFNQDVQLQSYLKFGGASLVSIGSSATSGYTLILPLAQGGTFSVLTNNGTGGLSWTFGAFGGYRTVTNSGATLAIQDRYIEVTTGATAQTLNVGWAAAGNTSILFTVMKIDSGLGSVTVQAPDLINGITNFTFGNQWEVHKFVCNGLGFRVLS